MKIPPSPHSLSRPHWYHLAACLTACACLSMGVSQAATLVAINGGSNPTAVSTVPTTGSPGFGTAGYRFYAFGTPPGGVSSGYGHLILNSLPSYVSGVSESSPGSRYLSVSNTTLTVSGTNYVTGYLINNTVTITLGSGVPAAFRLSLLLDNAGNASDRSFRPTISSPNGAFASVTVTDWEFHGKANNLLVLEIQNAAAGDQVAVTVNRLGGLLFDTVTDPTPPVEPDLTGYTLTFSDEFNGPLDVSASGPGTKWTARLPYGGSFGDSEFVFTAQRNPFSIENGALGIRAWGEADGQNPDGSPKYKWYSGLLATVDPQGNGFSQRYGYFEARMKMPGGSGTWPAFWLLTKGSIENPKRDTAEIDVVEFYGNQLSTSYMATHYWRANGNRYGGSLTSTTQPGLTDDFHTYGVKVTPETITWYLDGVQRWQQPTGTEAHEPLYLMVNYAMGSGYNFGYELNNTQTLVDYVRAYSLPGNPSPPANLNRALFRPTTASSQQSATFSPSRAVDGNGLTRWSSTFNNNEWIYVDLGARFAVNRVKLTWEDAYATGYSIQVSEDAANWTTIYSTTTGNGGVDDLTGLSGAGQYVRVLCSQRATQYGNSLFEFEVYGAAAPLPNLALSRPATASSVESQSLAADRAVDGTLGTRWSSAHSNNQWLQIDLGQTFPIDRVRLHWEASYASAYQVQVSDNATNWTNLYSTTTGNGGLDDLAGLSGSGRYVRILCLQRGTQWGNSLWEVEVYAPQDSAPNRALSRPVTASSQYSASVASAFAVDGNGATRWGSSYANNQWIMVDLGQSYPISRVKLTWETAYASGYQVQVSNDATNWTDIFATTTGNGGVDDLTGLSGAGRYVRIFCTQRATQWGNSLWEIEVY